MNTKKTVMKIAVKDTCFYKTYISHGCVILIITLEATNTFI